MLKVQSESKDMKQNYGVLRIVRVRPPANATTHLAERYPSGWLPEERLVHLLTERETLIGRALNNDIILLDPTVSREHARLVFDDEGWHIVNLTEHNVVRVNGHPVPYKGSLPMCSQDILILGSTMLQLLAPQVTADDEMSIVDMATEQLPSFQKNGSSVYLDDNMLVQKQTRVERVKAKLQAAGALVPANEQLRGEVVQSEPELEAQAWDDEDEESLLGVGVTLQFALPQKMGRGTFWLIAGVGLAFLFISALPFALLIERRIDGALQGLFGSTGNDVMRSALQGLNAGVTEETIKGLGLLLLFVILRDEFDNVTDGIVYGALIGAGFAMVENFRYFAQDFNTFSTFLIVYRIVLGWLGHSTFTVCFGAALGYVRHTHVRWRQIVIPLVGYVCAVGLHSFFDFVDFQASVALNAAPHNSTVTLYSLLALIGDYIPPFLAQMVLLYILIKSLAHEAAVIREFLVVEVSNGVVKVDEYALLQNSFLRTKVERKVLWRSGWKQWLRVKALYQMEIGLAFRKWHVSMGDKPKLGYVQPEDVYRQRIKKLRDEIAAAETKEKKK